MASKVFLEVSALVSLHGITSVLDSLALVTHDVATVWANHSTEHPVTKAWQELNVNLESALAQFSEGTE